MTKFRATFKHVDYKPDMKDWTLESVQPIFEALERAIPVAVAEAVHLAMEGEETYMYLPAIYAPLGDGIGGKTPADPLTMYFRLGVDSGEEKPTYAFNFRDLVIADISEYVAEDGSYIEGAALILDGLKKLVSELEGAVEVGLARRYCAQCKAWVDTRLNGVERVCAACGSSDVEP